MFDKLLNSKNFKGFEKSKTFQKRKQDSLTRIDKSNKKSIDQDIKPLIDLINSLDDYYTTSSCSGRILLIEKKTDKKIDARFIFAEHKKADFKGIKQILKKLPQNDVWFRQESIIIHICCKSLESAKGLLKIVRDIGIKRAGIININKRIIIEIIGTEAMETIIARNEKLLIDDNYLKILVSEANNKLERNKKKIKELFKQLKLFS